MLLHHAVEMGRHVTLWHHKACQIRNEKSTSQMAYIIISVEQNYGQCYLRLNRPNKAHSDSDLPSFYITCLALRA